MTRLKDFIADNESVILQTYFERYKIDPSLMDDEKEVQKIVESQEFFNIALDMMLGI